MEDKKDAKNPLVSFDFNRFVKQCFKSWKLMGSCVLAACLLAAGYLYLRQSKVQVMSQLMLPPESISAGLMQYRDLASSLPIGDMFGSLSTENEMAVMSSHTVFERTARDLGLNVHYLQKRYPMKWMATFEKRQLELTTLPSIPDTIRINLRFDISPNDDGTFDIVCKNNRRKLADLENVELPTTVETAFGPFTISKTEWYGKMPMSKFRILFSSYNAAAHSYCEAVKIFAPSKKTDFINVSFMTDDGEFGKKLLNSIINNYNYLGNQYRDESSSRTIDFVNRRLSTLEGQLAEAEGKMSSFKKSNSLVLPEADIATLVQKENSLESQILAVRTELEIVKMAKDFLGNPENNYAMLPNVPGAGSQMSEYNELILKRMKLLSSAKENNIALRKLNEQIDAMREILKESVDQTYENTSVKLAALRKENSGNASRKSDVPQMELEYVALEREVTMMRQLYEILLAQREEAEMTIMKTSVSLITVDAPYVVPESTQLSTTKVLAIAIFLGLCMGALLVAWFKMPKSPLYTASQIKKLTQLPVFGKIETYPGEGRGIISVDNKAAEDMRLLRANVMQTLEGIGKNVVLVTSATNDEGVTFVASNLAVSLAKAGYKAALVEANMRSPRLSSLFNVDKSAATLSDIISNGDSYEPRFEEGKPLVICAGESHGNPADMLGSEAMEKLIAQLSRESDYVLIDGTHMCGYSDVFAMAEVVDLTLVVASAGVTTPEEIAYTNGVCDDGRLSRMASVINAFAK